MRHFDRRMSEVGQTRPWSDVGPMSGLPLESGRVADMSGRLKSAKAAVSNRSKARRYSITSSARASSDGGTSSPSALAVLRFITVSYLVGACTGRSAGALPCKMRSTYPAARRY